MSITKIISDHLSQIRQDNNRIIIRLNEPSVAVIDTIESSGGKIVAKGFERWCYSDTCQCNSHDQGQYWVDVEVPQAWVLESHNSMNSLVWDYEIDEHYCLTAMMVVPWANEPILIMESKESHWAAHCHCVCLTDSAKSLFTKGE